MKMLNVSHIYIVEQSAFPAHTCPYVFAAYAAMAALFELQRCLGALVFGELI